MNLICFDNAVEVISNIRVFIPYKSVLVEHTYCDTVQANLVSSFHGTWCTL